jgi:outer membrane protein TolC
VGGLDMIVGPQRQKEMPEMTFPFPSALTLKGQIVDSEAQLARIGYEMMLRTKVNEMARACFRIGFLRKAVGFVRENRSLLTQIKESREARLRTGMVEQSELLMAQSDLAMLDARLTMLERGEEAARGKANALMDLPVDLAWSEIAPADVVLPNGDLTALLAAARTGSQDLKMAQQDVTLMELMVRMAETEVLPRGSLGYSQLGPPMKAAAGSSMSAGATGSGLTMKAPASSSMGGNAMGSGLTIKAPASSSVGSNAMGNGLTPKFPDRIEPNADRAAFGVNAAYLDELRIRVLQARRNLYAMRARTEQEVHEALTMYSSAARDRQLQDDVVVPKAQETFDNQRERYGAGTGGLQVFLTSGRARLDAHLKQAEMRSESNARAVDLWSALGMSDAAGLAPAIK